MLGVILRTIKARGVRKTTQKTTQKTNVKTTQKKSDRILSLLAEHPNYTIADLVSATGLSADGVKWNLRKLKDAQRLRRIGPDKGGRWEVVG